QSGVQLVPFLTDPLALGVVQLARVDQHTRRSPTIAKELGSVYVSGNREPQAVPENLQDAVPAQAIETQAGHMQDPVGRQVYLRAVHDGPINLLAIADLNSGAVRQQWPEGDGAPGPVPLNFREAIAPDQHVCRTDLLERERRHVRIRPDVQQTVDRVFTGQPSAAIVHALIDL